MQVSTRLFDFNIITDSKKLTHLNCIESESCESQDNSDDNEYKAPKDTSTFVVQSFGIDENGTTTSLWVHGFEPFFYVKVGDDWTQSTKKRFVDTIKSTLKGPIQSAFLVDSCKLIKRKKLYGFDDGKLYKFVALKFKSHAAFNRVKNLWYEKYEENKDRKLKKGYLFEGCYTQLYEAQIPPLLRLFHVKKISPSGWIKLPKGALTVPSEKTTTCDNEFEIHYKHIIPDPNNESRVPYKICSFDIEASSSHGDFPLPQKTYKKLATNIVDNISNGIKNENLTLDMIRSFIKIQIKSAFNFHEDNTVDLVYPQRKITETELMKKINIINEKKIPKGGIKNENKQDIEYLFTQNQDDDEVSDKKEKKKSVSKEMSLDEFMFNEDNRELKIDQLDKILSRFLPKLKGDEVTFIGSTFMKYGERQPYRNNCIAVGDCDGVNGSEIDVYDTEREALLAWSDLIQSENPDIIIGYNIFGFDYKFMYFRAMELNCIEEFLELSRNRDEICGTIDNDGNYKIEEGSVVLASGQYDLHYITMPGRIQIDMHNYLRRDYNLTSYKLDYVASHFIGDKVKTINYEESENSTIVQSKNLTGLEVGAYINFEESSHSTDLYKNGQKFMVISVDKQTNIFKISGNEIPDMTKNVRWGLAKDDVSPQDIFRMTHEGATQKAIIAKYCIQDCNLVHHLLSKIDVITGYIEMATICSIPISFLVFRGQGIKLTSYIAKKCREKETLMPVINKASSDDGYEGAIVLPPKTNLYTKPVACVDYSSLYPSSMISENLSHDSKVWTKEYDLDGNLIKDSIWGERNSDGTFKYDNLPGYKYVDVEYDVLKRDYKLPKSAPKVKCGTKVCRFAQFPDGKKAILPSILEELLAERKATRKLIPKQTDEFMKNVLDKRQLGIKVTANSLYGQTGAVTSTFYEQDVAASTTSTGRKLLIYGKQVIENVYGDCVCDTKFGKVKSNAEYIYGDTDSVFFTFNLKDMDGNEIKGKKALEITIDLAKEAGELATSWLKKPHDLEYEKTFMPFALLSKKRYVGMLYEEDPDVCYRKSMGIVLKRRDNADIVKDVYGGLIDILMKGENQIENAITYLDSCLDNLVKEVTPMEKLIITKSLRSDYKNPQQIAHKVLADRIGKRDPGNKPSPGDRIPFVHIYSDKKGALQGDKIELPNYIVDNKLKIDYGFYITNQIMKPVQQLFALVLEEIPDFKKKMLKVRKMKQEIEKIKIENDDAAAERKITNLRNKEIEKLLFSKYIKEVTNMKNNQRSVLEFFG